MKIIDLLNKIANGEEVPKKIKYKNKIYEWKEYDVCYEKTMTKKGWIKEQGYVAEINKTYFYLKHCYQKLNDEIEIIEEEKKIPEKLENLYKIEKGLTLDGVIAWQGANNKILGNKIDEIIDYLNSKGDDNNAKD